MDKKELALAVSFGKAPADLQAAVRSADDTHKKIDKLKAEIAAKQVQLANLERDAGIADKKVRQMIDAWDPSATPAAANQGAST